MTCYYDFVADPSINSSSMACRYEYAQKGIVCIQIYYILSLNQSLNFSVDMHIMNEFKANLSFMGIQDKHPSLLNCSVNELIN